MKAWIRKLLRLPPIEAGQVWEFRHSKSRGDPFPAKRPFFVTVLDFKDEWVRYSMGGTFTDERLKESIFRHCYRPYAVAEVRESLSGEAEAK